MQIFDGIYGGILIIVNNNYYLNQMLMINIQVRPWAPYQSPVAITGDLIAPYIGAFLCLMKSYRLLMSIDMRHL
tara:strand:+ start:1474 stop:1695 length:222 start_codon:yes stop_codon:yes gene_type:complete